MSARIPRLPVILLWRPFPVRVTVLGRIGKSVLVAAVWIGLAGFAWAHSFTVSLLVVGENVEENLAEAVRGFLLAADERDGHANETSDGHLGGVDVQILPLPRDAAGLVEGLFGTPDEPTDVVIVLGPEPLASDAARAYRSATTVLQQAVPPDGWDSDDGTDSFVSRYRVAYGATPGLMAATAYHAARRLDVAIRPLDGVVPEEALLNAWRSTESGLSW